MAGRLKIYNSSTGTWDYVSSSVSDNFMNHASGWNKETVSSTAPTSPTAGDIWLDTSTSIAAPGTSGNIMQSDGTNWASVPREVVLYDNATGINGTASLTLSETSANFTYLEFFFRNHDSKYGSVKVFNPNGKSVSLTAFTYNSGTPNAYCRGALASISGTTVTMSDELQFYCVSPSSYTVAGLSDAITLLRVVGYR